MFGVQMGPQGSLVQVMFAERQVEPQMILFLMVQGLQVLPVQELFVGEKMRPSLVQALLFPALDPVP
jgi:hypothetical protein